MERLYRSSHGIVLLGYGVALLLIYKNTISAFFVSDDFSFLYGIQESGLSGSFRNYSDTFFIPLFYLFNYLTWLLFELNATAHNWVNLLLHLMNAFLVFLLVRKVLSSLQSVVYNKKDVYFMAFFTGLLFLINPYQVEVAGWFSARSYSLSLFFTLLAAVAYTDYVFSGRSLHLYKSLLYLVPAFLSKEIAMVLPLAVICIELFFRKSPWKERLRSIAFYSAFLIIYWLLRFLILRMLAVDDWLGGYGASVHLDVSPGLLVHNLMAYLAKFFLMYRYLPGPVQGFPDFFFSWVFLLIAAILLYFVIFRIKKVKRESWQTVVFSVMIFVLSLAPVITLETSFLGNMQSDRYGYMASIPAMFLWVYGSRLLLGRRLHFVFLLCAVLVLGLLTVRTTSCRVKAAELVQKIGHDLSQHTHKDTVFVVNLPDNYMGAYVLRVGFADYMKLFYPAFSQKTILFGAHQNLVHSGETAEVYVLQNRIVLRVADDDSYLMRANKRIEEFSNDRINLHSFSRDEVVFDVKTDDIQIFYFNRGRLIEISKELE